MASKAVYYICTNPDFGPVAHRVWEQLKADDVLQEKTGVFCDGQPVMRHTDEKGNVFDFVPADKAVCVDYPHYLPMMKEHFSDYDVAGMVTWHEGASAPPQILTVHSLGDVNQGVYGNASPKHMHQLLAALEKERNRLGLTDFSVVPEATHWSGLTENNDDAALLLEYPVPMMDIEIGSETESWENEQAIDALSRALLQVFDDDGLTLHNLLCVGGVHFDPAFAEAVHTVWDGQTFGVTHIIANQWLVAGEYENEDGFERAKKAVESIDGGIAAIAFHDKMKGHYKDLVRALGKHYDVPIFKHQRLRKPETMELPHA